jgi:hypothetical protein
MSQRRPFASGWSGPEFGCGSRGVGGSMTERSPERLRRAARLAYEKGRLARALCVSACILPIGVLVGLQCNTPWLCWGVCLVLFFAATGFGWWGRSWGRAVVPGLVGAFVAVIGPACVGSGGHFCTGSACISLCLLPCILGGALAGIAVSLWVPALAVLGSAVALASLGAAAGGLITGSGAALAAVLAVMVSAAMTWGIRELVR